jgi:hypothetical protein
VTIGFQVNCFVLVLCESDHGDYIRARKKLLPNKSVREIGMQIVKQSQSNLYSLKLTLLFCNEQKQLDENHQVVSVGGPEGIRVRDA